VVVFKVFAWGLLAVFMIGSSDAAAVSHVEANGTVSIDKSCRKTDLKDLKVIVLDESPLGSSRPLWVPIGEGGDFSVFLSKSYQYNFQVLRKGKGTAKLNGSARFDPAYPEKRPHLVATCLVEAKK